MVISTLALQTAISQESSAAVEFLQELIRFPSTGGHEREVMLFIEEALRPLTDELERVPFPSRFAEDPEYSNPIPALNYTNRFNLRAVVHSQSAGQPVLLFNTHADVVPAGRDQVDAFTPRLDADYIYGRGACDAKGQIAVLYLLLRVLQRLEVRPCVEMRLHLVVEEENGGNGTLGMIRHGEQADAAIVLEPTNVRILSAVRGALWFRVHCSGTAGHSGRSADNTSALEVAIEAMRVIKAYHQDLLSASLHIPLFNEFKNPMPLTFGRLDAGTWAATNPDRAQLEGVIGFLPNRTREQVMEELAGRLRADGSELLSQNSTVEFIYRHNGHTTGTDQEIVQRLQAACKSTGLNPQPAALPASCDSWFYDHFLGIPTVVLGAGDLQDAHSNTEKLELKQLRLSAEVLIQCVLGY